MTADYSQKTTFSQIRQEWWKFIQNPVYIKEEKKVEWIYRLLYISKLYIINLGVMLALVPLYWLSQKYSHAEFKGFEQTWGMMLAIILGAPILEELVFRGLLRFNIFLISMWVSFLIGIIGWNSLPTPFSKIAVFVAVFSVGIIYMIIEKRKRKAIKLYINYFPILFHGVAIAFGLIHLANYDNVNNYFVALPLVSFQIILGYSFGFIRMKFGLKYSILMHIGWNLIATVGVWIPLMKG